MKVLEYSFIIPVYNRPNEIKELLESFLKLNGDFYFEIVIVEDGSSETSKSVVDVFSSQLNISYYFKNNSGPGDSRNFGMTNAKGNYFIILDSDVILPENYLMNVDDFLNNTYYHCFGGPDAAHQSFTNLQKAINFSMTSFLTTGGIRGGNEVIENFQPRSFNMGLSKKAFEDTRGFGKIHPGEDPDLSLRLHKLGYKTTLIKKASVFHKRRISWKKFYNQVHKFGMVRPILNQWHPTSKSVVYWLPSFFSLGLLVALFLLIFNIEFLVYIYILYFGLAFIVSVVSNKSIGIAFQSLLAICIQFFGYGYGFFKSTFKIMLSNKTPEQLFPKLFFK
ncbi:glycosyltransferase [Winogradskyella immobilis]|uniref:Glycosyltransferase n=1 Tax=Winogradskyella immobilis TaxID=2816852 RepID=A0ABS8EP55_9FLAO|nr:glycosyltransferase [Winogradskyella immobilis]MCC1484806.1 glycosyltransferase [Winogradskyella immobilis]MCG0016898.1 glycosyltransferase [Winogradskyella immobilis]